MSCAGSCLQTRRSTAWPAWPPTPAPMPCPEPSTTCRSLPLCTERATSEHSVSRPDSGPPAYLLWSPPRPPTAPSPHSCPTTLIFCMSLALSFCHYPLSPAPPRPPPPPPTSPASSLLPHTLVSVVFASHAMQQLSRFTKREREKCLFLFLFSCCHCFFFIKWIKLTYFIILNKKKVFFFTWLKIRDKNCNKEKLLYFFFLFSVCCRDRLLYGFNALTLTVCSFSWLSDPVQLIMTVIVDKSKCVYIIELDVYTLCPWKSR